MKNYLLNVRFTHINNNGFEVECYLEYLDNVTRYNHPNIEKRIKFDIHNLSKEDFQNEVKNEIKKQIESELTTDDYDEYDYDQQLTELYNYYFVPIEETFTTGKSISVNIGEEKDFLINFMLDGYFSDWTQKERGIYNNAYYALFISEISKETEELWKLEVVVTKYYRFEKAFSLGGKFKLYIKIGDVIEFKYHIYDIYKAKAEIVAVDYNTVTMRFFCVVNPFYNNLCPR
ncbi:MAG: hypothetical protein J6T98_13030 [Salinivirgaceae bacterium]|nr:hypothetical protein [Salinivirgaceae bacterium]